jgi:glycosyltransferase involved in cell wall biosynthesis
MNGQDKAVRPLVSVAMTAYCSAKWLPRAIDSVLRQRVDFPIEVIVGDDCSQDGTVAIARSYEAQYSNVVRVIERDKNIGIQRNYYETFEECRGRYIAWLDADDYWTDPDKLAIQVNLMESDSSINLCGHYVRWVANDGAVKRDRYPTISPGRYGLSETLRHNFLPSPSVLFRNGIHRELPAWYFDLAPTTDWPIYVLAALKGDIVLIDRLMADYTLTPGSALMSKGDLAWYRTDARFYEHIESVLPLQWRRLARSEKGRRYGALAYALRKLGEFPEAREAAIKAFRSPYPWDDCGAKITGLVAAIVQEAQWRLRGSKVKT